MNFEDFSGITDSPASIHTQPTKCKNCGTTPRISGGLCLKCLLEGALLVDESPSSSKTIFTDLLAEVELGEAKWRIGNYEIVDEIGRGGMGVIYRAREAHSHRIIALKRVLNYHTDSDQTLARFRREAETATSLDHPNIVPIYYVGEDEEGLPFFAMKFASGGNLAQARDAFRPHPRKAVSLLTKVAFAIQYAHEQGVLHRDLKPSNILLGTQWEPMVSDFGLAKWIEESADITRTLTVFGTPGYIAPEQATRPGMRVTPAADIYNLGAIMFELLTGRSPFIGEHALAVLQQAVNKPAPRLRSIAPHLDRDLETICNRCLEREPSARYSSAGDFGRDLQNWLERRPIEARPVTVPVRLWRWSRRNHMLAATLGAVLVLITASVPWGIHSWKLQKTSHETAMAMRSLAVLPFLNLDNITIDENLAQSIAFTLLEKLNRSGPTRITTPLPRLTDWATAEQIRQIGEAAKTRIVLTGTERAVNGKIRICLRVVEAASGEPLIVHSFEGNSQADLKQAIGREIGGALDGILDAEDLSNLTSQQTDPGLRNEATRKTIVAGRELMFRYSASSFSQAIALLESALREEPNSTLAHAYLSIAAAGRTHFISDQSFLKLADAEAHEALRLSPDSSDAHRALAGVLYQEGRFAQGLEEAMRTVETTGPDAKVARFIGMTLDSLGKSNVALGWFNLASRLARNLTDIDALVGDCWVKLGDDNRALQAYDQAAQLRPDPPRGEIGLCHLRLLQSDFQGARELCRNGQLSHGGLSEVEQISAQVEFFARNFDVAEKLYRDLSKTDRDGGGTFYGAVSYQSALGRAKQALGDSMSAKMLLEHCLETERATVTRTPTNPEALYRLAAVESSLGMLGGSVYHLRKALDMGWIDYRSLAMDPRFDAVREDARVKTILKDLASSVADMRAKSQKMWRNNL
jgi:serine/threonine protein kinase/Flp pilus assembly protein TadD